MLKRHHLKNSQSDLKFFSLVFCITTKIPSFLLDLRWSFQRFLDEANAKYRSFAYRNYFYLIAKRLPSTTTKKLLFVYSICSDSTFKIFFQNWPHPLTVGYDTRILFYSGYYPPGLTHPKLFEKTLIKWSSLYKRKYNWDYILASLGQTFSRRRKGWSRI